MIGDLISTLSDAQKLSIAQIQQAVQDGTLPAYVGIPLLQDKVKQRNEAAALLMGQKPNQPKVAEQVMAAADQITGMPDMERPAAPVAAGEEEGPFEADETAGIEALPSNLPEEYAGGGIIAFNGEEGSVVPEGGMYPEEEEEEEPVSQFRREFPGAMQAPRQLTPQTIQNRYSGLAPAQKASWERLKNYFTSQAPEAYAKREQEITKRYAGAINPTQYTERPQTAAPDRVTGLVDTPAEMRAALAAKPSTGVRPAAGNRQAIASLLGGTGTPESTIAAAPPKEDTTIADEIARSRGERADMMKMILGDQAADKKEAEENKWLALAKAGFGIAGGRSPYAMVNIGEGMSGGIGDIMAAKQLARKEQQTKQLAAAEYGTKSQQLENALREMGVQREHYKAMEPYYQAQTQESLADAEYKRMMAGLAPQKLALQAARAGKGGAGGVTKSALTKADMEQAKLYKAEALKTPEIQAITTQMKRVKPGSASYNRLADARDKAVADITNTKFNKYFATRQKQARTGDIDITSILP